MTGEAFMGNCQRCPGPQTSISLSFGIGDPSGHGHDQRQMITSPIMPLSWAFKRVNDTSR